MGQGVCRMPVPEVVLKAAQESLRQGNNLYAPAAGIPELRNAIANKLLNFNKIKCAAENVLVTPGSTGAFEAFCQAYLTKGDEVVSFTPFYPYHHNIFLRMGVKVRYVTLHSPDWHFDELELQSAMKSPKVKFILVNTPNNPTGKVFSHEECELIAALCKELDLICVTDEVYEYMTYGDAKHISIASLPEMQELTVTIGSYSKTFAVTGWRIGYLTAATQLISSITSFVDNIYVCAPTPLQHGVLAGVKELTDDFYAHLTQEYTRKREIMHKALSTVGLNPHMPAGAYYMIADVSTRFPGKSSEEVSDLLIESAKVGAVPASDFIGFEAKNNPKLSTFLRFCYASPDEMLQQAAENLKQAL